MRQFFILFLVLFSVSNLSAQVFAPDLLCVRNDSLFWEIPNNNCGTFNSYDIYGSMNENGPYSLLSQATNVNQTNFFHQNNGGIWYYYLESNYDCPNEPVEVSDTLDNLQAPPTVIQSASVNGANVELNWLMSNAPEVVGYVIYRETPIGVVPIDTVYDDTFYLDENASPTTQAETYYVLALDACGETSIFGDFHETIFVEGGIDECENFFSLDWNGYEGWVNGVDKYEIWVAINGEPDIKVGEVDGSITNFDYPDSDDGFTYCFSILGFEKEGENITFSNRLCQTLDIIQFVKNFEIIELAITENETIDVEWTWNINAELNHYGIEHSVDGVNFSPLFDEDISQPFPNFLHYQERNTVIDFKSKPNFFRISTIDNCGRVAYSNIASTLFLSGLDQENGTNILTWESLELGGVEVQEYEIFRIIDGESLSIGILDANTNQFIDNTTEFLGRPFIDYQLVATGLFQSSNGDEIITYSSSNIACVEQRIIIHTPNAFVPTGINNIFRPILAFEEVIDYSMSIYDRYGQNIFQTNDLNEAWDGNIKSRHATQGVYVYHIRITQLDGRITEKQGTVLLIR